MKTVFVAIFLLTLSRAFAQINLSQITFSDSFFLLKPKNIESLGLQYTKDAIQLNSKKIVLPPIDRNGLFRFVIPNNAFKKWIRFKKCFIGSSGGEAWPPIFEKENLLNLEFDSCRLQYLQLFKQGGQTKISNSEIDVFSADSCLNKYTVNIGSSRVKHGVFINDSKNIKLSILDVELNSTARIRIGRSSIADFSFGGNKARESVFYFYKDSLYGTFNTFGNIDSLGQWEMPNSTYRDTFFFHKCYINSNFWIPPSINQIVLIFNNCTFGPETNITDIAASEIHFQTCRFPKETIPFSTNAQFPSKISFVQSEIESLRMNFTSKMAVLLDTTYSRDVHNQAFVLLMSKFEREGKEESLKNVTLQYRKFSDSPIWYALNKWWWNYGYNKDRVFMWALGFLTLFFVINLLGWKSMLSTYPIVSWSRGGYYYRRWRKMRFIASVLIYTCIVFFSIHVSLSKLDYRRLRFVFLFFLQYFIGIVCMLFILNYILRV